MPWFVIIENNKETGRVFTSSQETLELNMKPDQVAVEVVSPFEPQTVIDTTEEAVS